MRVCVIFCVWSWTQAQNSDSRTFYCLYSEITRSWNLVSRLEQAEVEKRDDRVFEHHEFLELTIWQGVRAGLENIKPGA